MRRNKLIFIFALLGLIFSLAIGHQEQQTTVTDIETTNKQATKSIQPAATRKVLLPPVPAAENLLPKISFENTVCDLGEVGQGTKNTCEFKFINTGQGLLKIENIKRTCGCTVFKLDKKEYAPGEAGVITVSYSAGRSKYTCMHF